MSEKLDVKEGLGRLLCVKLNEDEKERARELESVLEAYDFEEIAHCIIVLSSWCEE